MPKNTSASTILAVCRGPGGIPKPAVDQIRVLADRIEDDGHKFHRHGGPNRAVCLFSIEDYRTLERDGVAMNGPGSFGENVLCEGLDFARLMPGEKLALGDEVVLEIHDVREPCATLKSVDKRFPGLMLGRSGFVCKVVRAGVVRAGDAIRRV